MFRRPEHPLFRVTALVAALCVFALAVFVASPRLHAGLHERDADPHHAVPVGEADHVCAVTLFAGGVSALLVCCLMLPGLRLAAGMVLRAADEIAAAQPRYRLVPSHAPPAA